ncbi:MAG: hypothetical protein AB7L90_02620 [Hyphomicrobiaceae bacterium]
MLAKNGDMTLRDDRPGRGALPQPAPWRIEELMRTSHSASFSRLARVAGRIGVTGAMLAAMVAGLVVMSAEALGRESRDRDPGGSVVACSDYGRGCIRGAVRRGLVEREVRMPGGTWIGCKGNCRRTLREESLDFFETLNERVWDN